MPIGKSNRVVVDLEPELKRRLYASLAREGKTLKEWLSQVAHDYIESSERMSQRPFGFIAEPGEHYGDRKEAK